MMPLTFSITNGIFAGAILFTGWTRARDRGQSIHQILWRQALHWLALALAVYLVFMLEQTGRLNREDAGLVALLALSLTTLLAGVHFDWRLMLLGGVLGVTAACAAFVEEFFWILLIVGASLAFRPFDAIAFWFQSPESWPAVLLVVAAGSLVAIAVT